MMIRKKLMMIRLGYFCSIFLAANATFSEDGLKVLTLWGWYVAYHANKSTDKEYSVILF